MCAKLNRCIHGLKQSPREWNGHSIAFLITLGFTVTAFDPCIMVHKTHTLFIAIYVDDITLFGPSGSLMTSTKASLKREFEVSDMGDLHWLLGIQIEYTSTGIQLSQTAYIDKILLRFGMQDCNPLSLPLDKNELLRQSTDEQDDTIKSRYQQIVRSLMYATIGTRPDLAFTVTHLSQFNSKPSATHLGAAKRVLRYLKGTRTLPLIYPFGAPLVLEGFTDSDHAACRDTRKSVSGYIFQLANCTISWRSRKQRSVATSSTEAEYMALAFSAKHQIWFQTALKELGYTDIPSALSTDNQGASDLTQNPRISDASKHIDIAYHFTRDLVEKGFLTVLHIPGERNPADICTKALPGPRFTFLRDMVMG